MERRKIDQSVSPVYKHTRFWLFQQKQRTSGGGRGFWGIVALGGHFEFAEEWFCLKNRETLRLRMQYSCLKYGVDSSPKNPKLNIRYMFARDHWSWLVASMVIIYVDLLPAIQLLEQRNRQPTTCLCA